MSRTVGAKMSPSCFSLIPTRVWTKVSRSIVSKNHCLRVIGFHGFLSEFADLPLFDESCSTWTNVSAEPLPVFGSNGISKSGLNGII